jgi:hypothetical protein
MKVLELFCGTKSFTKLIEPYANEIITLDFCKKYNPTICCDILEWDYTQYPRGYFDFIWASPNCKEWSIANCKPVNERIEKIENSRQIVKRTLDIISYFNPTYYVLENPQTGRLKNEPMMDNIPFVDLDYCKYGYPYRKRTRFWTNIEWTPKPLCLKRNGYCKGKNDQIELLGKYSHPSGFGREAKHYKNSGQTYIKSYNQRISIPPSVVQEIINCI